jgi:di/tricarboxylate transporter
MYYRVIPPHLQLYIVLMLFALLYWLAMAQQKQKTNQKKVTTRTATATRRGYERVFESDGTYLLKLVTFVLLGTLWIAFKDPISWMGVPLAGIPIGLLVGLLLVNRFEKHQEDRKIWYAILVIVTIISYFARAGTFI